MGQRAIKDTMDRDKEGCVRVWCDIRYGTGSEGMVNGRLKDPTPNRRDKVMEEADQPFWMSLHQCVTSKPYKKFLCSLSATFNM